MCSESWNTRVLEGRWERGGKLCREARKWDWWFSEAARYSYPQAQATWCWILQTCKCFGMPFISYTDIHSEVINFVGILCSRGRWFVANVVLCIFKWENDFVYVLLCPNICMMHPMMTNRRNNKKSSLLRWVVVCLYQSTLLII